MTSVIIPTYQGEGKISICIDALLNQTNLNFEIIVAIDGSTDNTETIVKEKLKEFANFKIIKQENKGRASIRNYGARSVAGNLLIFIDDDMRLFPSAIEEHICFHNSNPNSVLQGVQIMNEKHCVNDIEKYKLSLENKWEKRLIDNGINKQSPYLSAAHFSIPKKLFDESNGFDEKLTDAEDYDLAIRLLESRTPIIYGSKILAYHDDRINLKTYILRKRDYAEAQKKLNALYPDRYLKYSNRNFVPRKGWKKLIYKLLSSKKLVDIIDKELPLIMLFPKKARYKLYDIIIQGLSNYHSNMPL